MIGQYWKELVGCLHGGMKTLGASKILEDADEILLLR